MQISNNRTSNLNFKARIILANKNNAMIKKAINNSFNHEELNVTLNKILHYQPKTTLFVNMEEIIVPNHKYSHEISITNQANGQIINTTWGENGLARLSFGDLLQRLTNLRDEKIDKFWNSPNIKREKTSEISKHKIFCNEYSFDYEKHLKECEQNEKMDNFFNKLEETSSGLNNIVNEYKYDKQIAKEEETPEFIRNLPKKFVDYWNNKRIKSTSASGCIPTLDDIKVDYYKWCKGQKSQREAIEEARFWEKYEIAKKLY